MKAKKEGVQGNHECARCTIDCTTHDACPAQSLKCNGSCKEIDGRIVITIPHQAGWTYCIKKCQDAIGKDKIDAHTSGLIRNVNIKTIKSSIADHVEVVRLIKKKRNV